MSEDPRLVRVVPAGPVMVEGPVTVEPSDRESKVGRHDRLDAWMLSAISTASDHKRQITTGSC